MKPPSSGITTSSFRGLLKDLPQAVSNPELFHSNFTSMMELEAIVASSVWSTGSVCSLAFMINPPLINDWYMSSTSLGH